MKLNRQIKSLNVETQSWCQLRETLWGEAREKLFSQLSAPFRTSLYWECEAQIQFHFEDFFCEKEE